MPFNRIFLGLIIASGITIAGVLFGSEPGKTKDIGHDTHAQHARSILAAVPARPGQEVFGTIQEIVQILEADTSTDWLKVNIAALREHLIDMDEITMRAVAREKALVNGVEVSITGEGRTLQAIKRMIPAHTNELAALGWNARTESLPDGLKLVVTSDDPKKAIKLKALGFMGIMVQGAHHQVHHLMMAKGEFTHE